LWACRSLLLKDELQAKAVLEGLKEYKDTHHFTFNGEEYTLLVQRLRVLAQPVGSGGGIGNIPGKGGRRRMSYKSEDNILHAAKAPIRRIFSTFSFAPDCLAMKFSFSMSMPVGPFL